MILLDTHVCLWLLADDASIGPGTRARIESTPFLVSSVSVAEVVIEQMNGRITAPPDFFGAMVESGARPLPLTGTHSGALERRPELVRHDPFDRLLVAQADVEDVPFVTADRLLLGLGDDRMVDARA